MSSESTTVKFGRTLGIAKLHPRHQIFPWTKIRPAAGIISAARCARSDTNPERQTRKSAKERMPQCNSYSRFREGENSMRGRNVFLGRGRTAAEKELLHLFY